MGSGHVSHRRTSALNDHLDHSFVVFKRCTAGLYPENNVRLWSRDLDLTIDRLNLLHVSWYFRCYLTPLRKDVMSNSLGS